MNKQNILVIIIIILIALLGIVFWQSSKTADAPEQVSNNTQASSSASTEDHGHDANTPEHEQPTAAENGSFEKDITETSNSWVLTRATINQKQIDMSMNVPAPLTLQFDLAKNSYSGFAGCNNFSGTYTTSNDYGFDFGATVSTKKACPETMKLENSIFEVMDKTVRYGIKGEQLVFESEDGYTQLLYNKAK